MPQVIRSLCSINLSDVCHRNDVGRIQTVMVDTKRILSVDIVSIDRDIIFFK
jgi:hypothetical protein